MVDNNVDADIPLKTATKAAVTRNDDQGSYGFFGFGDPNGSESRTRAGHAIKRRLMWERRRKRNLFK